MDDDPGFNYLIYYHIYATSISNKFYAKGKDFFKKTGRLKNYLFFCENFLTVAQLFILHLFVIRTRRMVHAKKVKY
mgnify:CR=1 FL=1